MIILVMVVAISLGVITNLMFTMYHLYIRRKSEYQQRLLNVLFSHLAITLQIASFLNILNILTSLGHHHHKYNLRSLITNAFIVSKHISNCSIFPTLSFPILFLSAKYYDADYSVMFNHHELIKDVLTTVRSFQILILFIYLLLIGMFTPSISTADINSKLRC